MSKHKNLIDADIHAHVTYTYANAAARTGAVLASNDKNKIVKQTDTGEYFLVLNDVGPVYRQVSNPSTTKGDLPVWVSNAAIRVPVGGNGQVLTADSAETSGVKWATPAGAGATGLLTTDLSTGNITVAVGNTLFVPNLIIALADTYTINGSLVSVNSITATGTLTVSGTVTVL